MMLKVDVQSLKKFVARAFEMHGAPVESAERVSAHLVRADRAGHPSHGVVRVVQYLNEIRTGQLDPRAAPEIARQTPVSALIDGNHAFGQVVAWFALETGLRMAHEQGMSAVATMRSRHVGRVGEYTEAAAAQGLIGVAWGNGQRSPAFVAPFGGRQARHGTNPFSMAAPRGAGQPPVVADFATSIAAEGKVRVALNRGKQTDPRWLMDRDGNPTVDPQALYEGGALRPFGEHKGYGLSFMCDVLAGLLTGSLTPCFPDYPGSNSLVMIFLDPQCFRPRDAFANDVDRFCEIIKKTPAEEGVEEVFVPGEPEQRRLAAHADAMPLDEPTWQTLCTLAADLRIDPPTST